MEKVGNKIVKNLLVLNLQESNKNEELIVYPSGKTIAHDKRYMTKGIKCKTVIQKVY